MPPDLQVLAGCPVIVGAGLAGLMTALELAPSPVTVLTMAPLGQGCASCWSQGGLAAAVGSDDSVALHVADTIAAGDGLCDEKAVQRLIAAGPSITERLIGLGVRFSHDEGGAFKLKLEAAHSRRRVLNAGGDGTGAEIMRAVIAAVRETPSITVLEGVAALDLIIGDGVEGVVLASRRGTVNLPTRAVVLATGGLGGLWLHTTNPEGALGQGVALAARAGAALIDLEFVQFHPTALDVGSDPMPLASEALRGEGALLIDEMGTRFMAGQGRGELEPRDIVARAVWRRLGEGHRVFLDTRACLGADLPRRFPFIAASCRQAGIDPVEAPIPIRPAAHYHMGGIAVDARGRTSVSGLWACGENAATGLHGANRLASNSLLEAAVTGTEVAHDLAGSNIRSIACSVPQRQAPRPDPAGLTEVRTIMSIGLGVLRDEAGLEQALAALRPIALGASAASSPASVGLMIAAAAWQRRESRGGHFRTDFPAHDPALAERKPMTLKAALAVADGMAGGCDGHASPSALIGGGSIS